MGMYDELPEGQQVKCWHNAMITFHPGDEVPQVSGEYTYSLALREGGFAVIRQGVFTGVFGSPAADGLPVFDKWGNPFEEPGPADSIGDTEYPYRFADWEKDERTSRAPAGRDEMNEQPAILCLDCVEINSVHGVMLRSIREFRGCVQGKCPSCGRATDATLAAERAGARFAQFLYRVGAEDFLRGFQKEWAEKPKVEYV